ncbi:DUF6371 domain-containing protein [Flavobacterium sp. GT3R68]|uniref:DUF6371 domain-containing protein n=1 Tax=Flavobacterium sp. GT3R68 TaxID=2594437 RepID=UPI000F85BEAE|nr:DUF6371 domain-containing protein [Flavobacterium sp. GT3R68]RTY90596.1 hypothetical protein EKL32_20455 [Flavobacterium sp. GSN2]TRW89878.1 hypothetical protein FNW07_12610 [Flavobacterium sp. GT3R68]
MLQKTKLELVFNSKRDYKLITPCCGRNNTDGKFINYKNLSPEYGYCHSCGKASLPPAIYVDETGEQYIWNELENKFQTDLILPKKSIINVPKLTVQKFVNESIIWQYFKVNPENNLLQYLRKTYGDIKTEDAKETYALGTSNDGGIIFWSINSNLKVQKAKIAYYETNGKRTNQFKVPYKNENGYFNCLFGEHLVYDKIKSKKTIVLTESEKTAIIGYILFPQYVWVAYGGINGLTENKVSPLIGHNVLIIPDMSENAVSIILNKILFLISLGINAKIWDMTESKTDEQLKLEGVYNNDLEDVFRKTIV